MKYILTAAILSLSMLGACKSTQTKSVKTMASKVKVVDDHLELSEHIHFETGKADIKADSHDLLNQIATLLKNSGGIAKVHIRGHTDNSGDPEFNKQLSEQRAGAVETYLKNKGVTQMMDVKGLGPDEPLCKEDTAECRAKNRRVEFLIEGA